MCHPNRAGPERRSRRRGAAPSVLRRWNLRRGRSAAHRSTPSAMARANASAPAACQSAFAWAGSPKCRPSAQNQSTPCGADSADQRTASTESGMAAGRVVDRAVDARSDAIERIPLRRARHPGVDEHGALVRQRGQRRGERAPVAGQRGRPFARRRRAGSLDRVVGGRLEHDDRRARRRPLAGPGSARTASRGPRCRATRRPARWPSSRSSCVLDGGDLVRRATLRPRRRPGRGPLVGQPPAGRRGAVDPMPEVASTLSPSAAAAPSATCTMSPREYTGPTYRRRVARVGRSADAVEGVRAWRRRRRG